MTVDMCTTSQPFQELAVCPVCIFYTLRTMLLQFWRQYFFNIFCLKHSVYTPGTYIRLVVFVQSPERGVTSSALLFIAGDCSRCKITHSSVGYVEDVCDCSKYYQCKLLNSGWIAYHRECAACVQWNQATLSCSTRVDGCTVPTTATPKSGTTGP